VKITELITRGKKRIDGKRFAALNDRGLGLLAGLEVQNTLLYCTGKSVEVKAMYWADLWVVDMLDSLSTICLASDMSKFYTFMKCHRDNKKEILSEAGLLVLSKV
jgi:hypothetical protein